MISKKWLCNYSFAKKYYEEYGNLNVNYYYKVKDKEINLGVWISHQRCVYNGTVDGTLTKKQIDLLNEIGMVWKIGRGKHKRKISKEWISKYNLAKKYYEIHNNLLIPALYFVKDEDDKEINLGAWIACQRQLYKNCKLSLEKVELLEKLKMVWEVGRGNGKRKQEKKPSSIWLCNYDLAKKYYEEFHDLLIPALYNVENKDGKKIKLGTWISNQRVAYKNGKLNEEQIELLEKIGMVWSVGKGNFKRKTSKEWIHNYNLLKGYYNIYINILVMSNCKVICKSGKEVNLKKWLEDQRFAYKNGKLNEEQIGLLEEIGMVWIIDEWIENYKALYIYNQSYGDTFINKNYAFTDKNIVKRELGEWIVSQTVEKEKGMLSSDKIRLLDEIGVRYYDEDYYISKFRYINNNYNYYLRGYLSNERVNLLLKSGAFIYSDDNKIVANTVEKFSEEIQKRL